MKIMRNSSGLFSRPSPTGRGCAPLFVLVMVAMAVVGLGRHWIGQRLDPNRQQGTNVSLAMAQAAFAEGDLNKAVAFAQQILEWEPTDSAAYQLLIRALIYRSYSDLNRESDRQRALDLSRSRVESQPRNLDTQAVHGYALQANGYAEEAGRIALRIVERAPDHVLARIVLSLAYGSQGIFEAALREAALSVDLAEQQRRYRLESRRALAIAQGDRGNYQAALTELEQALDLNGKLIPLHFESALFALQISDIDRATVSFYRIVALDQGNVKVRVRLCELSNRLHERDSAMRYCREVTELAPNWSDGWYKLGRQFFLSGHYEQAQVAFNRCARLQIKQDITIDERQLECWYLQGQSAEIRGDCDALLSVYREFQDMAQRAQLPQTWIYPPVGPPICTARPLVPTRSATPDET